MSVFEKGTRGEIIGWNVHISSLASDDMFGISHKEFSLCSTAKFQKHVFGLSCPTEHVIYILYLFYFPETTTADYMRASSLTYHIQVAKIS